MRTMQRVRAGWLVGALGVCVLFSGAVQAELLTSTERPGSILIFPKVVSDGTRDTVIQITNTGTMLENLRCFYLDKTCTTRDFDITLTKQQPTVWRVGEGRRVNSTDILTGIDPGNVPVQPVGFFGALVCVEVGPDDAPFPMNKLKGEATLEPSAAAIATGNQEYSKYNAIAIQGSTSGGSDDDNALNLDASEYGACPAASRVNFIPDGNTSDVIEQFGNGGICVDITANVATGQGCNTDGQCAGCNGGTPADTCRCQTGMSRVSTIITVIPCNLDFENGLFPSTTVVFDGFDDLERHFSGSQPIVCWGSFPAGTAGGFGGEFATLRLSTPPGESPILGVAESFFADSLQNTASAAVNLHMEDASKFNAVITLSNPN